MAYGVLENYNPKRLPLPEGGERIIVKGPRKIEVPDNPVIPFIEGDGVGADIWKATQPVIDAAVKKAYDSKRKISWYEVYAGQKCFDKFGKWLIQDTFDAFSHYIVGIKGPLTTPVGGGFRSLNVTLRQTLDLYACIRPVKYYEGAPSPMKEPSKIDMVIYRENTEDVYAGIEWKMGTPAVRKLIDFLNKEMENETHRKIPFDSGIGIKPISEFASKRIMEHAIWYASTFGRKSITIMHKGNIMKYTEGAFKNWCYEAAAAHPDLCITEEALYSQYAGKLPEGKILIKDRIADSMFQQIHTRPEEYDIIVTPNLNGDYISDAAVSLVGGLGIGPGSNIGDVIGVFEATHGTAPKYTNMDKINPGSLILSGAMMLDYMGWTEAAELIRKGLVKTIANKTVTYDFARQMPGSTEIKCSEYGKKIIENM